MEGKSQARLHRHACLHQGDPSGRRHRLADRRAGGDPRVPQLPGEKEAETEILVGVVCGIDHRSILVRIEGRLTLAQQSSNPAEQAKKFIDASLRGRSKPPDRKSTRLNSSHSQISYAV